MSTKSSSAVVAALCLMMLLSVHVHAACDTGGIIGQLVVCLNVINNPGPPDKNGPCCTALQKVHNDYKPDPDCICTVFKQPQVQNIGLNSQKAALYIATCVSQADVPACLGK